MNRKYSSDNNKVRLKVAIKNDPPSCNENSAKPEKENKLEFEILLDKSVLQKLAKNDAIFPKNANDNIKNDRNSRGSLKNASSIYTYRSNDAHTHSKDNVILKCQLCDTKPLSKNKPPKQDPGVCIQPLSAREMAPPLDSKCIYCKRHHAKIKGPSSFYLIAKPLLPSHEEKVSKSNASKESGAPIEVRLEDSNYFDVRKLYSRGHGKKNKSGVFESGLGGDKKYSIAPFNDEECCSSGTEEASYSMGHRHKANPPGAEDCGDVEEGGDLREATIKRRKQAHLCPICGKAKESYQNTRNSSGNKGNAFEGRSTSSFIKRPPPSFIMSSSSSSSSSFLSNAIDKNLNHFH